MITRWKVLDGITNIIKTVMFLNLSVALHVQCVNETLLKFTLKLCTVHYLMVARACKEYHFFAALAFKCS